MSGSVEFLKGASPRLDRAALRRVKARAGTPPAGRARLCAHRGPSDPVHEMLIAVPRGAYVRPHRHKTRAESYHVVEGRVAFYEFDAKGRVTSAVAAGTAAAGGAFYLRQRPGRFHGLLVLSKTLVFLETRPGPLRPADSEAAPWAPPETDRAAARRFVAALAADWRRRKR